MERLWTSPFCSSPFFFTFICLSHLLRQKCHLITLIVIPVAPIPYIVRIKFKEILKSKFAELLFCRVSHAFLVYGCDYHPLFFQEN